MATDYLIKHAGEVLDFPFDWNSTLQVGETISTVSTTVIPSGDLAVDSGGTTVNGSNVGSPVISGGTAGEVYTVRQQIVTDQGRTNEQERSILVV